MTIPLHPSQLPKAPGNLESPPSTLDELLESLPTLFESNRLQWLEKMSRVYTNRIRTSEKTRKNNYSQTEIESYRVNQTLIKAILATEELISFAHQEKYSLKIRENQKPSQDFVERGANANREWLRFFITFLNVKLNSLGGEKNREKIMKIIRETYTQLLEICDKVFTRNSKLELHRRLTEVGLGSFIWGIYAVLDALIILKQEKYEETFYAPTAEEDMRGIDLISEKRKDMKPTERTFYQIKGEINREGGQTRVEVFELPRDIDGFNSMLNELEETKRDIYKEACERLLELMEEEKRRKSTGSTYTIRACFVRVLKPPR